MVLLFKGIAPPSQFPATIASGAPPRPNHACCQGKVDVCSETHWRSKGGRGLFAPRALRLSQKKNALSVHYVPTTSARTPVAHRVQERMEEAQNKNWLPNPCLLGCPKSELVGPTSGRKCYITLAFSGIPKDMGDKIRIGGAHKWAEMLHHPCILGDPQRHGGQNQNWWGPQVGGNATSPLHSRGSPKTWGTKSELVGPTSGWKCYITPAFSGIPNKGDKVKAKKSQKKQKQKFSHGVPGAACSSVDWPHWGLNPGPSSCRGTALPTRVWPISDIPLHRGGIHIWSNLVFIHYWVLLKKLSILSIDTWGEDPFFHPLRSQAKFP